MMCFRSQMVDLGDSIAEQVLQGRMQDFLKGGSENLRKGVWSAAPEAIGICIVKHQNHTRA